MKNILSDSKNAFNLKFDCKILYNIYVTEFKNKKNIKIKYEKF